MSSSVSSYASLPSSSSASTSSSSAYLADMAARRGRQANAHASDRWQRVGRGLTTIGQGVWRGGTRAFHVWGALTLPFLGDARVATRSVRDVVLGGGLLGATLTAAGCALGAAVGATLGAAHAGAIAARAAARGEPSAPGALAGRLARGAWSGALAGARAGVTVGGGLTFASQLIAQALPQSALVLTALALSAGLQALGNLAEARGRAVRHRAA